MEKIASEVVLVVEDEYLIRADTADILADEGFEVLQASDAEEALELLCERPDVSVLFTDVNLPGISGLQLAHEVERRWPHIGLVVTSGRAHPTHDDIPGRFIGKPYQPRVVVETVRDVLGTLGRTIAQGLLNARS